MAEAFDPLDYIERYGADRIDLWADAEECERDLSTFFRRAWSVIDPAELSTSWHHDAIADHLMAVSDGEIKKLLINVPFRSTKTLLANVCWNAWTWAQRKRGPRLGPQVKFLCLTYASPLSMEIATTTRRLVASQWYQDRWGDLFQIAKDQDNKEKFDTTKGGYRISTSFDGGTMGRGGDIKLIDDPHKVKDVESEDVRRKVIGTYDEALSSRFTDPETSAEVVIMQRLHSDDLSGHVLNKYSGHVHLMIPAEYDPTRHCHTVLGWQDPRGLDKNGNLLPGLDQEGKLIPGSELAARANRLFWPGRFSREIIEGLKTSLGPYAAAGQLQQAPTPRGGGIIKAEWWRLWEDAAFPDFSYVAVSVDTAPTEKEQNDEAAITAWGVWPNPEEDGKPNCMLVDAWEGRLEISRLVAKIAEMCKKRQADVCLIEAKSNGIDVINEIRRLHGSRQWTTIGIDPKGDKVARLLAVQPMFSGEYRMDSGTGEGRWIGGNVYAPDRDFAQLAIDRVSSFPKARQKGIVDTVSQFMNYARAGGLLVTREEHQEELDEDLRFKREKKPVYDV